jgi:uncharacterized protein
MSAKNIIIAVGILILAFGIFFVIRSMLGGGFGFNIGGGGSPQGQVKINDKTFKVFIAETPKDKQVGLSSRTSLPQDQGMVFLFDNPDYYSFWMKEMKFPIDIIFINNDRVVTVHKNAQPPASEDQDLPIYRPDQPADTVLEINAGLSDEYDIKPGDTLDIQL